MPLFPRLLLQLINILTNKHKILLLIFLANVLVRIKNYLAI